MTYSIWTRSRIPTRRQADRGHDRVQHRPGGGAAGRLISWDERDVTFDLLVTIPVHSGSQIVGRSPGLGDDLDFVSVDRATRQSEAAPNVFAIGDATNVPTSKAGSVAHFQGETLVANIRRFLDGHELEPTFDGHTNCFIETGPRQGTADRLRVGWPGGISPPGSLRIG